MPSKAAKLLERMRRSKQGWKRIDLDKLYLGFGFVIEPGSNHDRVYHPDFPQLRETLPRHRKIAKIYVDRAVRFVDELIRLQEEASNGSV